MYVQDFMSVKRSIKNYVFSSQDTYNKVILLQLALSVCDEDEDVRD